MTNGTCECGGVTATTTAALESVRGLRSMDELTGLAGSYAREKGVRQGDWSTFFTEVGIDLTSAAPTDLAPGYAVQYLRAGSVPGGRVQLDLEGNRVNLRPGQTIRFPKFRWGQATRHTDSLAAGVAQLVIHGQPGLSFEEPDVYPGITFEPVYLLGSDSTFTTVLKDTQPAGAAPTGSFLVGAARRILLLLDRNPNGALANADTFTLAPWVRHAGKALWHEMGIERISLPDSSADTRYQAAVVSLEPMAVLNRLYFEVNNLLPAANTGIGFAVQVLS